MSLHGHYKTLLPAFLLLLGVKVSRGSYLLVKLRSGGDTGGHGSGHHHGHQQSDKPTTLAGANDIFGKKLFAKVVKDGKNLICSPFSASAALTMVYIGARGNTEKQMTKALALPEKTKTLDESRKLFEDLKSGEHYELEVANKAYIDKSIKLKEDYVKTLEKHFHVKPKLVNFIKEVETRKEINAWVEKKTHMKIKNIIQKGFINPLTKLILVNAMYFKGTWKQQFNKKLTQKADFHVTSSKTVKVDMMYQKKQHFMYKLCKTFDSHILELPYRGDRLSMFIILPRTKKFDLTGFEEAFTHTSGMEMKEVSLWLPRFKVESEHKLKEPLEKLGMTDIFGKAVLSGITNKGLVVSDVIQKSFVEVNEEGTEAAAATAVGTEMRMVRPAEVEMKCDHPFLFTIKDKASGMLLFTGKVVDPTKH